jgi:hypothetical protein
MSTMRRAVHHLRLQIYDVPHQTLVVARKHLQLSAFNAPLTTPILKLRLPPMVAVTGGDYGGEGQAAVFLGRCAGSWSGGRIIAEHNYNCCFEFIFESTQPWHSRHKSCKGSTTPTVLTLSCIAQMLKLHSSGQWLGRSHMLLLNDQADDAMSSRMGFDSMTSSHVTLSQ